jgi:hypothetical protein
MKDLKLATLSCVLASGFVSTQGQAANEIGNGGDLVKCHDSLELLDLFEARSRGLILEEQNTDPESHAKRKLNLLASLNLPTLDSLTVMVTGEFSIPYIWAEAGHDSLWRNLEYVVSDYEFPAPTDRGELNAELPEGCQIIRIAHFEVDGKIRVAKEHFDQMSRRDQSALLLHELLYRGLRMGEKYADLTPHKTSQMIRSLVGDLFSKEIAIEPRFVNFPDSDDQVAVCRSYSNQRLNSAFFLYPDPSTNGYRAEFFVEGGLFRYTSNNRDIGQNPIDYRKVFEHMCTFADGSPWQPSDLKR